MVHHLPCGTKFLRVIIFVSFPAHIFPAKNFSTVNIFQLKFFQSILSTISHPRCYCNRITKKSHLLHWLNIRCRVHKLKHCLKLSSKENINNDWKILTMTGLRLSEITKINSQQEKTISPNCKICSRKTQKLQTSANISCHRVCLKNYKA